MFSPHKFLCAPHCYQYQQHNANTTFCGNQMPTSVKKGDTDVVNRGGVRSTRDLRLTITARGLGLTVTAWGLGPTMTTRGLGPTMTAWGQSISLSIGMLPQTLIMSRLDQLSRLAHEFSFFIIHKIFPFWGDMEAIMVQKTSKCYTMEFDLEGGF
jgi:hypothetical protein